MTLRPWLQRLTKILSASPREISRRQRPPLPCAVQMEQLECRQFPAASVAATFTGGLLHVQGTDHRDVVTIREHEGKLSINGQNVKIDVNGNAVDSISRAGVTRIEVDGLQGDDFIAIYLDNISSFSGGVDLSGGRGSDVVVARNGVGRDRDSADRFIDLADFRANPLQQARYELLYRFRDEHGYVVDYSSDGQPTTLGEGTLHTAIAAIAIATGNHHQDAWESAQANAVLESLLNTLLDQSWGNRDGFGREHPIRHPSVFDYAANGDRIRNSPLTKDSFGAIVAAAYYAYENPNSSAAVRGVARELITKWSEYLVANQWRTHSNYISGEFDTQPRMVRDGDTGEWHMKGKEKAYKNIYRDPQNGAGYSGDEALYKRQVIAKGVEGFVLAPHERYALQNVAAKMGVPTSHWNVWSDGMPASVLQTIADVIAPNLGEAAGQGLDEVLQRLNYDKSYDIKISLGGRDIPVLRGHISIGIPDHMRAAIVESFGNAVRDIIREGARLGNLAAFQQGELLGLAVNRILDLLPEQLGRDSWRSLLTGAMQQVTPWLDGSALAETATFIGTLQLLKGDPKPEVIGYTLWSYAAEFETRPEMAQIVRPFVQEFMSFLRGHDIKKDGEVYQNPNGLWAWLAGDTGRVNEQLDLFYSNPQNDWTEFAYGSTPFGEVKEGFAKPADGAHPEYHRLDLVVLQSLQEMGAPRTLAEAAADWPQKFANAAEDAFNKFVASVKQQWNEWKNDLGRLADALRNGLHLPIGDVAGIVWGVNPDLGKVASALKKAGADFGVIVNQLWSKSGKDLNKMAKALDTAGAKASEIVVELWSKAGKDLEKMARALDAAGAKASEIVEELWSKSGKDLTKMAKALDAAGAKASEIVEQLWNKSGKDLTKMAKALDATGAKASEIVEELWSKSGKDLNKMAKALDAAGAKAAEIVEQLWNKSGNDLNKMAKALNAAGAKATEIVEQLWSKSGKDLNKMAKALDAAGASVSEVVNQLWSKANGDLNKMAQALDAVGANVNEIVNQLWDKAGNDIYRMANLVFGLTGDAYQVARALYAKTSDFFQVARALFNSDGLNLSRYQVARILFNGDGLDLSMGNVVKVLFNGEGLDLSLKDVARVIYSGNGLNASFNRTVSVLCDALGKGWSSVYNAVKAIV